MAEMAKTAPDACKLTEVAEEAGKHHIGDFLPPEELSKFMNKYKVSVWFISEMLEVFQSINVEGCISILVS